MNDLELIFSMLGEASTTEITRSRDSQGFDENLNSAKDGGKISGGARKKLEKKSGRKVTSKQNYLEKPQNEKLTIKQYPKKRIKLNRVKIESKIFIEMLLMIHG